jgi:hypothetical protein
MSAIVSTSRRRHNESIRLFFFQPHRETHGSRGTTTGIDYDVTDDFEDASATHTIDDIIEHIGDFGLTKHSITCWTEVFIRS